MNCVLCESDKLQAILSNISNQRSIGNRSYSYLKCNNCGLWMLDPYPNQEELNKIYDDNYQLYEGNTSPISKLIEIISPTRIKTVLKYVPSGKEILDLGCGNGTFLKSLQDSGYKVFGTEWSPSAAEQAKAKIGNENILVGDFSLLDRSFDAITLWHVLEHNLNPKTLLKDISTHLTLDGYLFIEVPNSDSLVLKKAKQNYKWFSIPEHVTYWNQTSLLELAKASGFTVVESYTPFSMPFLWAKSHKSIASSMLSPFLQAYAAASRKGDIIRQVWKKSQL